MSGFMTGKALDKAMKAKGLQKLRWYCQMCEKQCRDDNGFKNHLSSESHIRQMQLFAETPQMYIEKYSKEFLAGFTYLLKTRYCGRRVFANDVYRDYIADRNHLHMNATKWSTLSDFVKWLGKEGLCEIEEEERGWYIKWIDKSPEALKRREEEAKKKRLDKSEEELELKALEQQISKANQAQPEEKKPQLSTELKRDNNEKISLNLSLKPQGLVRGTGIQKINPFKSSASSSASVKPSAMPSKPKSTMEAIIQEEMQRKRHRDTTSHAETKRSRH